MRRIKLLLVISCSVFTLGCDAAKVEELNKQVAQLRDENTQLKAERDKLQQKVAQTDEIRKGYEEARTKFQGQLAGLKAVLGTAVPNPLPPFEGLKNSDWVGQLMPGAAGKVGNTKDFEKEAAEILKGILGGEPNKK